MEFRPKLEFASQQIRNNEKVFSSQSLEFTAKERDYVILMKDTETASIQFKWSGKEFKSYYIVSEVRG